MPAPAHNQLRPRPQWVYYHMPGEMIISNYDPGNSRDDQPIPENQVLAEAERLNSSKKAKRLQTAEAKRNRVNILSTRDLACCNTSTNRTANVIQLANGIVAHKFTGGSSLPTDESQGLDTLGSL